MMGSRWRLGSSSLANLKWLTPFPLTAVRFWKTLSGIRFSPMYLSGTLGPILWGFLGPFPIPPYRFSLYWLSFSLIQRCIHLKKKKKAFDSIDCLALCFVGDRYQVLNSYRHMDQCIAPGDAEQGPAGFMSCCSQCFLWDFAPNFVSLVLLPSIICLHTSRLNNQRASLRCFPGAGWVTCFDYFSPTQT